MDKMLLRVGDVVQITPEESENIPPFFKGCLAIVTEVNPGGCHAFIAAPKVKGSLPARYYVRLSWADMEFVGAAHWASSDELADPNVN